MSERQGVAQNTDREIWRGSDEAGDYYADSVFVTEAGSIGINSGGRVVVLPPRSWVALAWGGPNHGSGAGMKDIERLARAVYERMPFDDGPDPAAKPDWVPNGNSLKQDEARMYVRAVLQAMREPSTQAMAAGRNGTNAPEESLAAAEFHAGWQAAIDHMLSEAE